MKLKGEYILKISADIYKLASSSQSKAKSSQSRLKSPTSPTSFLHESIAQHKMRTQCAKTSQTPDFGAYACRMLCVLPHLQTQIRTRSGAYTVKILKADKSRWYDLNPQEDELSEVRLCGALAGELGHAHGRGRWTHHFHLPPTAYHIVWDFEHGTFSSFRMISSYQRIIKSFFPLIIRVCTMLLPNLNPRGHQPPQ